MNRLLIIKDKNHISTIKNFCEKKGIDYELYISSLNFSQLQAEKIKMFSDYEEAVKDRELESEKIMLEQSDEANEYDEYEQEEWAK